ncbi:MAG: 4-phosphoerythronate dehydrogenase, partial [Bacteroidota bacterium]|nr:4-phosphoerythronate dehydrogenase [Bacteroidota bacterium]
MLKTKKLKIIADDKIPFLKGVLDSSASIEYHSGAKISNSIISDSDAMLLRTRTKCNATLLHNSNVSFIATATIGFDHIDTNYCAKNNITWKNSPGCNSSSVMQYIASALLYISEKENKPLNKYTVGVVGVGHVGTKVARLADILGCKVLQNDPPRAENENDFKHTELSDLLKKSDIITFHVPLSRQGNYPTYHIVNDDFFHLIKKNSWLINSSRGSVVDGNAVLRQKKLAGIILDVWEGEPKIDKNLLAFADIATSHIAGYSVDGKAMGTQMVVRELSKYFDLGFKNWTPQLPSPERGIIDLSNTEKNKVVREAINHTYNIKNDDDILRNNPDGFEQHRGKYGYRWEFQNYTVIINSAFADVEIQLKKLGFKVEF